MDAKNYTTKYYKMVWERGKKDTKDYYHKDRRGWIYNIGSAVLVAVITPIVSYVLGQIASPSDFWLSVLVGVFAGLLVLVLWYVVMFISHLWCAPAKLYSEMQSEANLRTWKDIEIKVFSFPEHTNFKIGLKVTSHKPLFVIENNNIREYTIETYPEIEDIKLEGRIIASRIRLPMLMMGIKSVFKRSNEILNQRQFNNLVSTVAIPVACHDGNKAWITDLEEKYECIIEADKIHTLQIGMRGSRLEMTPMDGCAIFCDLLYSRNKEGQMEISLDITSRVPDYEE